MATPSPGEASFLLFFRSSFRNNLCHRIVTLSACPFRTALRLRRRSSFLEREAGRGLDRFERVVSATAVSCPLEDRPRTIRFALSILRLNRQREYLFRAFL